MRRFQGAILVACLCFLAAAAVPLTETERKVKPSKVVSGGSNRLLAPIDNAIKTESDEEQQHRALPQPQSLLPPPTAAAKKAAVKPPKTKVDSSDGEFVTGHRIPPEIVERRNKAAAAAAYVDSSSFRQAASAPPPLPPPSLSSPLLDYALLSDESDHAFFSTRDSFLPDYEFEY